MESINTRLRDLREPYGGPKMKQADVARALGLPASSINEYETEGVFVSSDVIIKYSEYSCAAEPPVRCGESHQSGL